MYNILNKHKLPEFKKNIEKYTNFTIFGKGSSFKNIPKKEKEFRCAINQAANFLDEVDLLCMNDLHNVYLIKDEVYKKLKFLLIPEYLHVDQHFSKKGYWKKILEHLKDKFNGTFIIYNLKTSPNKNKELLDLNTGISSANTCFEFFSLDNNIKTINLYGIGVYARNNYHSNFKGNGFYSFSRIATIKNNIIELSKKYNKNVYFN